MTPSPASYSLLPGLVEEDREQDNNHHCDDNANYKGEAIVFLLLLRYLLFLFFSTLWGALSAGLFLFVVAHG